MKYSRQILLATAQRRRCDAESHPSPSKQRRTVRSAPHQTASLNRRKTMNDETMLERLKKSIITSGYSQWLGAEPVRCANGEAELVIPLRDDLTQHHGFAHGSVVGAAADNVCAWAAASVAGDVVTHSYTLQLLAPAKGERLRATGKVIRSGRRLISVRADVFAEVREESRLVATALASVARLEV